MYICIYIYSYIYIYIYVYMQAYIRVYEYTYLQAYLYTWLFYVHIEHTCTNTTNTSILPQTYIRPHPRLRTRNSGSGRQRGKRMRNRRASAGHRRKMVPAQSLIHSTYHSKASWCRVRVFPTFFRSFSGVFNVWMPNQAIWMFAFPCISAQTVFYCTFDFNIPLRRRKFACIFL